MAATTTAAPSRALHPRAAAFTVEARGIERRIGVLFAVSGLALVLLMGVLGLVMRLTQATVVSLSPGWFYRLLTLHGVGTHRRDLGQMRPTFSFDRCRWAAVGRYGRTRRQGPR
jgi:hypothetical protein